MFSSNQKIPKYSINVEFLISSNDIISGNITTIPININKNQLGTENLYVGKKLKIFFNDNKYLSGTYIKKINNLEYFKIDNSNLLSNNNIQFNINSLNKYYEINNSINDTVPVTINDIKRLLKTSKNNNDWQGESGLLEPIHLETIESIKTKKEITSKSISELISYTTIMYYETNIIELDTTINFGLFHSLFNCEFELKIFNNNFILKNIKFGSSDSLPLLNIGIVINKIPSNDNSKQLYQILIKLINIPTTLQSNVEKVSCYVIENLINNKVYLNLPINYTLTNLNNLISEKIFSRYVQYYDKNGVISFNLNESIKLLGNQNLNNLINYGWYHYDVLNLSDNILNNLPTNLKNIFYINIKKLSDNLLIQYLYIYDSTNSIVKTFSRVRNNTTSLFSNWVEYVTNLHKHNAVDIITDSNNLFVTQQQIDTWNSYQNSINNYWNTAVATINDLPSIGVNGECRLVLNNMQLYVFLTNDNQWKSITNNNIFVEILPDNIKIRINNGGTNKEFYLPFVSDNNPGILPKDFHQSNWKDIFESNLNFTVNNTGEDIPGNYQKQLEYTFNTLDTDNIKILDGIKNYVLGTNGETRTLDLTNLQNKINKTFYSKYDNNNIYSGIVNSFQFIIVPNKLMINKLIFGDDKIVNIIDENGTLINHTNTEYILNNSSGVEYIFKINNNNINIYLFKSI